MGGIIRFDLELKRVGLNRNMRGASMREIVRLISRSERERARMVREARAIYDSIFPATDLPKAQPDEEPGDQQAANPSRGDRILS